MRPPVRAKQSSGLPSSNGRGERPKRTHPGTDVRCPTKARIDPMFARNVEVRSVAIGTDSGGPVTPSTPTGS